MARQKSIIKLEGTIGDLTFYRSQDGHLVREKGGVSADKIRTDPRFQRTRENNSEFGRAGNAGKTLRRSVRSLIKSAADSRMVGRLTQAMVKVIQADASSVRGQRNVIDGETELLKGFDFNINSRLGNCMYTPYEVTLERDTGTASVSIGAFATETGINFPQGATHFRFVSAAAAIDFEAESFISVEKDGGLYSINAPETAATVLQNDLPPDTVHPLFYFFGISFFQEVNGVQYPLKNGAYNALQIIEVKGV